MDTQETFKGDLGPLEPILQDPEVTEILVDGRDQIAVVRRGKLEDIDARFDDAEHLLRVIRAIVAPSGQQVDESHPLVEARLFDGSLLTAVIPPICLNGPALAIRKFRKADMTFDDLIHFGSLSQELVAFLRACVLGRMNILVAGGSASGKTTLINLIAALIPDDERVITVENTSEIQLNRRRIVRLEARPPNLAGKGAISVADLVVQALKMLPERLIVGELRGAEVWPLIQAINNGHDGSMATMHANTPRDAMARLEIMATSSDPAVPLLNVREQMASALDLIVQINRLADGRRKVTHITEVQRMEREVIALQDIFTFVEGPRDEAQRITGRFAATGQIPSFLLKLRQHGVDLPVDMFRPS
ncbi:MAG: CpaF family protein [Roseiflexaceae bacterium]